MTDSKVFTADKLLAIMHHNIQHVKERQFWNRLAKKPVPDSGYATVGGKSPRRRALLVQRLQDEGFTVHAPPSYELFQKACENFNDNAMCYLRDCPLECLEYMIMVEIKNHNK